MKVMYKTITAVACALIAVNLTSQVNAAEILGGGGNAASKLILDWASVKPGYQPDLIKFSNNVLSNDLSSLQSGNIDFAIVDDPLSDAELASKKLQQFPFVLSGVSIVVNMPNNMTGTIRLDGPTLGKIFTGEISTWDDAAIVALNPRHELPNKPITIVQAGDYSTDYAVLNNYLGSVSSKWKSGDGAGKREWPASSIFADTVSKRIANIKNTPYAIGYLPMQYMPQPTLSTVHIKNKSGNFVGLSDISILDAASNINIKNDRYSTLSLADNDGNGSWPISNFTFIVVKKDRLKEESISQILGVIEYGLKSGSLKPTVHNFVALPYKVAKSIIANIDPYVSDTSATAKSSTKDSAQQTLATQKRIEEELNRQRNEAKAAAPQDDNKRIEDRNRAAKQLADEQAREQAIREARAAKQAAEEAIRAANAAKLEAEKLAEKNRLMAKAAQEKADKEKAERERIEKEQAEKERAIQQRNQKDEDPLEAYRRSVK